MKNNQFTPENNHIITVKINEDSQPTVADLEAWREAFEKASENPNFIVAAHEGITVEIIKIDDIE